MRVLLVAFESLILAATEVATILVHGGAILVRRRNHFAAPWGLAAWWIMLVNAWSAMWPAASPPRIFPVALVARIMAAARV